MNSPWFGIPAPFRRADRARVAIIPAPYEGTVSYGRGASLGPTAIQAASPFIELHDALLGKETFKIGIAGRSPLDLPDDPRKASLGVKAAVAEVLAAGQRPVLVGGEHSLSLGAVEACLQIYPDLSALQLDAHADLRDRYEGSRYSHACVMRRVAELGVGFASAGVRAVSAEEHDWLEESGVTSISAREAIKSADWVKRVLAPLSGHVYLTLDVDVLDPSEMPATGCPEPGGLSYHHLLDLILALAASGKEVVGLDLMELAPILMLHHPQYAAASLLYTMIGAFWASDDSRAPDRRSPAGKKNPARRQGPGAKR